jgi:hypothetical protein
MSRLSTARAARVIALAVPLALAAPLALPWHDALAQGATRGATGAATPLTAADVKALAGVHVRLLALQDSLNAEMAHPRHKKAEEQVRLQEALLKAVDATIRAAGLSPEEFQRRRGMLATHEPTRRAFDEAVVELQAAASPPGSRVASAASASAASASAASATAQPEVPKLPSGPVGTHLGHVLVSFADTPGKVGLLAVAKEEATIAAQHAAFAARTPTNLEAMQRHAGHVLHAIDPSLEASGPGKGYGVKKAATGVAAHTELAAKAEGAPAGVRSHAEHVATAARTTVTRAEEIVQLAQKIRAAKTAEEAAALVAQMVSLCEQLATGTDLNADGRIGWNNGEGGLRQAEEHLKLLLAVVVPGGG